MRGGCCRSNQRPGNDILVRLADAALPPANVARPVAWLAAELASGRDEVITVGVLAPA